VDYDEIATVLRVCGRVYHSNPGRQLEPCGARSNGVRPADHVLPLQWLLPELVQEGRNGWVFDPLQPEAIVQTLEKALSSAADLRQMGAESRLIVADHTPQRAAEAIWAACNIALNSKRA